MRVAFVDLVFAWPPPGGAQTALVEVMTGLQARGFDVHLFCRTNPRAWRFGDVDTGPLEFPCTVIDGPPGLFSSGQLLAEMRRRIDEYRPDVVFLGFCRWLEPHVAEALAHYPLITRYYMYEPICPRDFCLFRKKKPCPENFLASPNTCRRCMVACWKAEFARGRPTIYPREQITAGAYLPGYHQRLVRALRAYKGIIVSNVIASERIEPFSDHVHIIPHGVNVADFTYDPLEPKERGDRKIILMAGRADDLLKGFKTLLHACRGLAATRDDFELWVTQTDPTTDYPWLKNIGFRPYSEVMELYRQADICVVPSVWNEPFGLVAVEAMATGRPVCASRVGGLQHIVQHDQTGFLFERKSSVELALYLERLLDDPQLRRRMGDAGRERAARHYDWNHIIESHHPALLEAAAR